MVVEESWLGACGTHSLFRHSISLNVAALPYHYVNLFVGRVCKIAPIGPGSDFEIDRSHMEFGIARMEKLSRNFSRGISSSHNPTVEELPATDDAEEVVIALGANVGDRVQNINSALKLMRNAGIQINQHSCLYETVPMHITEQPLFLNSAVCATTTLDPHSLLKVLKGIEAQLGRCSGGIKYGPRPIDLDIIFYGTSTLNSDALVIPHSMFKVRPFVLAPLIDLVGPEAGKSSSHWSEIDGGIGKHWDLLGGEECVKREGMKRVLPVGKRLLDWCDKTYIMGILNLTPDSFSDGGKYMSMEKAISRVQEMVAEGADFIDIGAQSTRPNARRLTSEEELERLMPMLEKVACLPFRDKVLISVDTFNSKVAREAVLLGADMINDVSAGSMDKNMLRTIAELEVPYVLMHMRGDPGTMQKKENLEYENVVDDVAQEVRERIKQAEVAGIPAWRIVTDPGFGFAKSMEQNVALLKGLDRFRKGLSGATSRGPILSGLSRKSFLGKLCGLENAEDRDFASCAAFVASILKGANIVRAHNVKAVRDAVLVADAIKLQ